MFPNYKFLIGNSYVLFVTRCRNSHFFNPKNIQIYFSKFLKVKFILCLLRRCVKCRDFLTTIVMRERCETSFVYLRNAVRSKCKGRQEESICRNYKERKRGKNCFHVNQDLLAQCFQNRIFICQINPVGQFKSTVDHFFFSKHSCHLMFR